MVEFTMSWTGTEFFRALVKNLATVMDTAGAWVAEQAPECRRLKSEQLLRDREEELASLIESGMDMVVVRDKACLSRRWRRRFPSVMRRASGNPLRH